MRIQKEYKVQTQDIVTLMGLLDLDSKLTKEQKVKDSRYFKNYDIEVRDNQIKLDYLQYLLDTSNNEEWVTISYLSILGYVSTKTDNKEEFKNLIHSIELGWFEGLDTQDDTYFTEKVILDSYFGWKGMMNKCEQYYVKNSIPFYNPSIMFRDTSSEKLASEVRDVLIENSYQRVYSKNSYCYYMFDLDGLDRVYKYLTNLIIDKPTISNQYFVMRKNCYKILMKRLKEEHRV